LEVPVFACFFRLLTKHWKSMPVGRTPWEVLVDELRGGHRQAGTVTPVEECANADVHRLATTAGHTPSQFKRAVGNALDWLWKARYVYIRGSRNFPIPNSEKWPIIHI
jgi:hypothetical protein